MNITTTENSSRCPGLASVTQSEPFSGLHGILLLTERQGARGARQCRLWRQHDENPTRQIVLGLVDQPGRMLIGQRFRGFERPGNRRAVVRGERTKITQPCRGSGGLGRTGTLVSGEPVAGRLDRETVTRNLQLGVRGQPQPRPAATTQEPVTAPIHCRRRRMQAPWEDMLPAWCAVEPTLARRAVSRARPWVSPSIPACFGACGVGVPPC